MVNNPNTDEPTATISEVYQILNLVYNRGSGVQTMVINKNMAGSGEGLNLVKIHLGTHK